MKKAAVGAAAAGVVWSAPRVEGLSLRPSYAAAGSGVGGGGVTATGVRVFFDFTPLINFTQTAGTGQLGSNASGNPAFVSVRGSAQRTRNNANGDIVSTRFTLNEMNWNGVGAAFINGMSLGGNLGNPTPSINGATPLPTNMSGLYDAMANVNDASRHSWRTTFTCS